MGSSPPLEFPLPHPSEIMGGKKGAAAAGASSLPIVDASEQHHHHHLQQQIARSAPFTRDFLSL